MAVKQNVGICACRGAFWLRFVLILAISLSAALTNTTYAAVCPSDLPNGGFETGTYAPTNSPDGWSNTAWQLSAAFTWDNTISHSGSKSVKISDASPNDATWTQTINLTPDTKYILSGWIKTDNVSATGQGANLCLFGTWTRSQSLKGTNDWTYITLLFDSGATGEVTIGARLGFWGGTSSGTAWFDDLRVTEFAPPGPASDNTWDILVLVYDETDFYFTDAGSVVHHVTASMTAQEVADTAAQATAFVENDVPLLNSGYMTPTITIRYPEDPLSSLSLVDTEKWWPAPADVAADLDPAFDSVIVVWDPRGYDHTDEAPRNLNKYAGLTAATGTGQAYTTIYAQGAMNLNHRNIYKHEWGHSILFFYDAAGLSPKPFINIDAFPPSGPYVHYPTGDDYIWVDETLASPIPNSIYHNTSGFTHDYYSGITATADVPTRALGVPQSAWAAGGPVTLNATPDLVSITRADTNPTRASTVDFTVTFNKSVHCLGTSDFTIDASGPTGASVTGISGSGHTYTVTVNTGTGEGSLSIDFVDDDTVHDCYGRLVGGPGFNNGDFTAGEAYTIDRTPPTVSIGSPSASLTNNGPVSYTVTYSGADTINLTAGDVTLNKTGSANASVSVSNGSTSSPTVTLNAITGNGTLGISIDPGTSTDLASNADVGAGPSATFTVDNTPPTVSISGPSAPSTIAGPITYTLTYAGATAISLAPGDITLHKTASANGTIGVSGSGNTSRTVTISGITGDGTLGISVSPGTASDDAGNTATGAGPSSIFWVDNTGPIPSIGAPSSSATNSGPVTYTVSYTGAATISLAPGDISLNKTGSANGTIGVSGSGNTSRTVTISGITGDGTLGISIGTNTAVDFLGNNATGAGPSATFLVDNTPPGISIGSPSETTTAGGPVNYTVTYTGASAISLAPGDVSLNSPGSANATVGVSGSGTTSRTVTLSSITGDGTLGITIAGGTATDTLGNSAPGAGPSSTFLVDNTGPTVTVDNLTTNDSTPALSGTINDAAATVSVTVDGQVNAATNSGSTWSLADGTLSTLAPGTYNVQVTATDALGNAGSDATTDELTIQSAGPGDGGTVTSNIASGEMREGGRLELTAPDDGSFYLWKKDGVPLVEDPPRVTGTTSQTLIIDPVEVGDSGLYTAQYEDNVTRNVVETEEFILIVLAVAMPAATPVVLFLLALLVVGYARFAHRRGLKHHH